ncbi:endonuclease/exonuclease/phosphatase family protein [Cryomorpha ignava]|uniref:Endonuclease/exonuclease/phosphatase family protein n=1 Tax=Cryomorpha ignava TaxID=101383 RepID=A0A7K3WKS9_9FLAO|nr:endonuclease/exonuclease/phosphatase family protein [Cryomorpha ignava]NEN22253.1 endonuclease/exonuclease/phosphatase family protein [Cryomorpha ignava]
MTTIIFYTLASILIILNLLPIVPNQHWAFRAWDFGRIQLLILELLVSIFGWALISDADTVFYIIQALIILVIVQNMWLLFPYTPLYNKKSRSKTENSSKLMSILSVNVYQFNTDYHLLINLIAEQKPDIVFTVESNSDWEKQLCVIENDYPYHHKHTLENTYGMHFYSKHEIVNAKTHTFVSDDIPSFEIDLKLKDDTDFTFFGVHPPPPSPSEEQTSKERDGDLLSVAKRIDKLDQPIIVAGDFNNVAWARSSKLFHRTSGLIDPRLGYGLVSTFHAKYKFLRVPIDLLFHSSHIYIEDFKRLSAIGSDHFPMFCSFYIDKISHSQEDEIEEKEPGDKEDVEEKIEAGKKENGDRHIVASE